MHATAPFNKVVRKFLTPTGEAHRIEFLGDGQQVVVSGIHPDTGQPYTWLDNDLTVTPIDQLPTVGEHDVHAYLDLCAEELKIKL
jgi:hypothetical protein